MTQTIGIIGAGLVGKAVARLAIAAGCRVIISNSRGPDTLSSLIDTLGPRARAGNVDEVIAAADIVTLAVPLAAFEALPADKFAGKVVLDQTNYYPGMAGFRRTDLDDGELTSSELMQRYLRGAKLVKSLHNLSWIHMESNARPKGAADRTTLPIAGDDLAAKDAAMRFIEALGFNVVDAGTLADSWRIEPGTPIYFWRYAPLVPDGVSADEAKRIYQRRGEPISPNEAHGLIAEAVRPSPIGGTLDGMPQVHVDLFLEQASADTVGK